jgi:hypothetical protein
MRLAFRIKHYFFNAFREIFVHHHGSLEFRAKIFALLIAANKKVNIQNYIFVKNIALDIYKNDEDRANLLLLSTKELVNKVKDNTNGLNIDALILSIQKELKIVPRYAKKIDIEKLREFLTLADSDDTYAFQENILEFLEKLKNETLNIKPSEEETTKD